MTALVAVADTGVGKYPHIPPYHPSDAFPEYPFGSCHLCPSNTAYSGVRDLLRLLELDGSRFGTTDWNPLGDLVQRGGRVLIKPNFVISSHPQGLEGVEAAVVHGSVLRALIDYASIAVGSTGTVVVADSPIKEVVFEEILQHLGMRQIEEFYRAQGRELSIIDLRDVQVTKRSDGVMTATQTLSGDPLGYQMVDLADASLLAETDEHFARYRSTAAVYENVMQDVHRPGRHLYSIPYQVLLADLVISVAKLKTHHKAGVTLTLKNAVGITNEKRWLPHHRVGSPREGGDAHHDQVGAARRASHLMGDLFSRKSWGGQAYKFIYRPLRAIYRALLESWARTSSPNDVRRFVGGDWYGNDTTWRMALDLNMILNYADRAGQMRVDRQRAYLGVVDGIVGGENDGPLVPDPHPAGLLLGGLNPVAVDAVATEVMGLDVSRVPLICRAARMSRFPLGNIRIFEDIKVASNAARWSAAGRPEFEGLGFAPSRGWKGILEARRPSRDRPEVAP